MTIAGDLEGIDRFTCSLCWEAFGSPGELLLHEAAEDDRLYPIDGLGETWTVYDEEDF